MLGLSLDWLFLVLVKFVLRKFQSICSEVHSIVYFSHRFFKNSDESLLFSVHAINGTPWRWQSLGVGAGTKWQLALSLNSVL